ncbi:MAG TPA: hypothetical protein VEA79_04415, partial [Phenylobacterium sp.]|nr:hypothetical protein [Phenylobacterium sp.]
IGRFNGAKAVLSDGADTIGSDLTQSLDLTLGDGADTFSLYDDGIAATGFSNLRVEGQSVASYAKITDFTKGEDHVVLGDQVDALTALTTFVGEAATLEAALVNVSSRLAANDTGVFEYKGSTYIYHQDATVGVNTGDGLIQLVGVTGLTTGTGAGPFDIHYG